MSEWGRRTDTSGYAGANGANGRNGANGANGRNGATAREQCSRNADRRRPRVCRPLQPAPFATGLPDHPRGQKPAARPTARGQRFSSLAVVVAAAATIAATVLPSTTDAQVPPLNVELVANWDGQPQNYTAADLWADDKGYAYVCNRLGGSIDIMDISDPQNPFLDNTYQIPGANAFCNAKEVKVHDGLMFIGLDDDGQDGVEIVDVRDPRSPQRLVDIRLTNFSDVHNMFYDGGYLYVANGRNTAFAVVDLTDFDPDNPPQSTITQAKWTMNVGSSLVHDVTVIAGRAYVCGWDSGIFVYDVSDIANQPPQFLGSAPGDNTHSVWPTRDKRWIVCGEERTNGGPVKLYEVQEEPFSVTLRDTVAVPLDESRCAHNVYVVGYRLYVSWYNRGMMVFDINPDTKKLDLVAHYDTSTVSANVAYRGAWGVYPFLGRDKVMVSDKETQFWIFDVRVPGSGDFNGDANVDVADYAALQNCFSGDGEPYAAPDCDVFDSEGDLDVDLVDYDAFHERMTGAR